MFLTILRYHVREGHLQYLLKLQADLTGGEEDEDENAARAMERIEGEKRNSAKNDSISCDLGLRYPLLRSILAGSKNHQTLQARINNTRYRT